MSYAAFKTDPEREKAGVVLNYDTFRVTVARAGGANKNFQKIATAETKPFQRLIEMKALGDDKGHELMASIFAKSVILKWEVLEAGEWKVGIRDLDETTVIDDTPDNRVKILKLLPELFVDIVNQAKDFSNFNQAMREAGLKNS